MTSKRYSSTALLELQRSDVNMCLLGKKFNKIIFKNTFKALSSAVPLAHRRQDRDVYRM